MSNFLRALLLGLWLPSGLWSSPLGAQCVGQNLVDALPAPQRQTLSEQAHGAPYSIGNLWTARRNGESVTLVGTFHLSDDRHDSLMAELGPLLDAAPILLVEAGPDEEAALKAHLASNPDLLVIKNGPTLAEQLAPDEWDRLKRAMSARGIPGIIAAKMQPWFVAATLGLPACLMSQPEVRNGLDQRLITAATARALSVQPLEPYDTILKVFDGLTPAEQLDMVKSALAVEDQGADMIVTMADLYFRGESRMIWEFSKHLSLSLPGYTPQRVEAEFAVTEAALITWRNRAWIDRIEAAAATGPAVVAFGALHLSGNEGVLNLLAQRGWTVTPLNETKAAP